MPRWANLLLLAIVGNCLLYGFLVVVYYQDAAGQTEELRQLRQENQGLQEAMVNLERALAEEIVCREIAALPPTQRDTKAIESLRIEFVQPDGRIQRIGISPSEKVWGRIKRSDLESGLVEIDLGSDSGLQRGHTLHVYRRDPEMARLGVVLVVEVHPNKSMARPVVSWGAIKPGDSVASESPSWKK